jgi:glycosyltransferase involved in cell wall biosynthesis
VSVVILTHNEQVNIGACLRSVASFDDVHVLDSGSSDRTLDIANELNAKLHHNAFTSFANQRNWAIDNIPTVHRWILHLDADERMTEDLSAAIERELAREPIHGGYFIPSKLMFGGRWLKHAGDYPTYQVRLFHRERLRFIDYGHGQRESTSYTIGRLQEPYLHDAFNKGMEPWFAKHAGYARLEAQQAMDASDAMAGAFWKAMFGSDKTDRRRALKRLSYSMPWRAQLRWLYLVIGKRAFLDGKAGMVYANMMATYESMVDVHLRYLRLQKTAIDAGDAGPNGQHRD